MQNVREMLEITAYDKIDSEDYLEVLEHKFRKAIGVIPVVIHNMKFLKSKNASSFLSFSPLT